MALFLRVVDAKRNVIIFAVVALTEFTDIYLTLTINAFVSESASDNYATYELLDKWDINAAIAMNKTNTGNRKFECCVVNGDGVPVCSGIYIMVRTGFFGKNRCRIKCRCSFVLGRCDVGKACLDCSDFAYIRIVYTEPA